VRANTASRVRVPLLPLAALVEGPLRFAPRGGYAAESLDVTSPHERRSCRFGGTSPSPSSRCARGRTSALAFSLPATAGPYFNRRMRVWQTCDEGAIPSGSTTVFGLASDTSSDVTSLSTSIRRVRSPSRPLLFLGSSSNRKTPFSQVGDEGAIPSESTIRTRGRVVEVRGCNPRNPGANPGECSIWGSDHLGVMPLSRSGCGRCDPVDPYCAMCSARLVFVESTRSPGT
jgi:hypothetical protein